jgi:hypothetical protein
MFKFTLRVNVKGEQKMGIGEEVLGYFDGSFSMSVQEAMIKCVFNSYAVAYELCKRYPREESHDLLGFLRWIELRSQLRGLGGRFNEIETYESPNGSASSYHIVIDAEKLMLTVSSVPAPAILPRPASYRLEYAIQSQYELFEQPEQKSKIYGILIHGANSKDKSKPAFIQVRFPETNYGGYIPHRVDLFARHNDLVKDLLGVSSESSPLLLPKVTRKVENET